MRRVRRALIALLPLGVLSVAACGTTSPQAGAAYGGSTPAAASSASAAMGNGDAMSAKAELLVDKTSAGYVLTTSTGRTVYWYSKDKKGSGKSACTGSCAKAWPAVEGTPTPGPGVTLKGTLGTITLSDGATQATYNGYPLYTYAGDSAAGQVNGNGVGGVWHVISGSLIGADPAKDATASAKVLSGSSSGMSGSSGMPSSSPSPSPSASSTTSSSSGGGYGY